MDKKEVMKDFGLEDASLMEQTRACLRVVMAEQLVTDMDKGNKIRPQHVAILREGAIRLLSNKDLTPKQRKCREQYYFDKG